MIIEGTGKLIGPPSMRMEIRFSKKGEMKYISHLDLMRLFQRAIRRAELPFSITKGFSPHLKISIKKALKLGVESDEEIAYFYLEDYMEPNELVNRMNRELPSGIRIIGGKFA